MMGISPSRPREPAAPAARKVSSSPVLTPWERLLAWALVSLGVETVFYFAAWWQSYGAVADRLAFTLFAFAAWFSVFRMVFNWVGLLVMARPVHQAPAPGLSVDVMTTAAPGEPQPMIQRTLEALVRIRYPHTTYLLDDSHRDELRAAAARLGVQYIRRPRPGQDAKAGNVNHALQRTSGEFVAIFDPDHAPGPEFLDRILGQFKDPRVGFVQSAQAYANQADSLVARGAAEQTYELYGPTMMALHGVGAPFLFGCHTTFRRTALESIGGYAVHNAEDLRTTMRLYARGWRGVYVPEILARGLVPADLGAYLRQQFRWSHSMVDLLLRDYWRLVWRWTGWQAAAFFLAGTYYLVGIAILANLALPVILLLGGGSSFVETAEPYALHLLPVIAVNVAIRRFGQRHFLGRKERGWHPAGTMLLFAASFAHTAGVLAAALGWRVRWRVTAKTRQRPQGLVATWPHAAAAAASLGAVVYSALLGQEGIWWVQGAALWNAAVLTSTIAVAAGEHLRERA